MGVATAVRQKLPMIAIVGRPNVGKSTLFNRVVRRRKAIILNTPGLTRDRNFEKTEWNGRDFLLVDTGGYEPESQDAMLVAMREQTTIAIEEADALIFLVDVREGINTSDREIMDMLRRSGKPVFVAVNKCDHPQHDAGAYAFSELGVGAVHPVSAMAGHGVADLLDAVLETLPGNEDELAAGDEEDEANRPPRIAIVGRQNVGKSTLVNIILGENRVIASPVPGTTRDSIDTDVEFQGRRYTIIDTAGIRRRGRIEWGVEKLSVMRSEASMIRADVAILMIDAGEGLTGQDAHIAGTALESGCAAIIAVNKWDLVEKDSKTADKWMKALREELGFLSYAPILFLSALSGQRAHRIFELADKVLAEYRRAIDTAEFNKWLEEATARHPPPTRRGRAVKIKYGTQTGTAPPTFKIFTSHPESLHFSYERYLMNQMREKWGFEGTPIRLQFVMK